MTLRVSTIRLYNSATRRMMDNQKRVFEAQESLVTGKKLNSAGENPSLFSRVVSYKGMKNTVEQYLRNISNSRGLLSEAESNLELVTNNIVRAKELAIVGASGTTSADSMDALAEEVSQIRETILSLANSSWSGGRGSGARYLFAGYNSDTAPFNAAGIYQGDSGEYQIEVGNNERVTIGLAGDQVFQGTVDIFGVLDQLYTDLAAGDSETVAASLGNLDMALTQITKSSTVIGARENRLDQTEARLDATLLSLKGFISESEDVNLMEAATDFTRTQAALEASLRATQKIFEALQFM